MFKKRIKNKAVSVSGADTWPASDSFLCDVTKGNNLNLTFLSVLAHALGVEAKSGSGICLYTTINQPAL